jgi:hypothetical protein
MPRSLATNCEHHDRPINGRGLCKSCYDKWLRTHNPEYAKKILERKRENHKRNPEKGLAKSRKWRIKHPEYGAQWYQKNRKRELERAKERRIKNPQKIRERVLARKYGLDPQSYQAMLEVQGSRCSICDIFFGEAVVCVDHDHTTGKIRGLLCQKCNVLLGLVHDKIEILTRAIQYLNKP